MVLAARASTLRIAGTCSHTASSSIQQASCGSSHALALWVDLDAVLYSSIVAAQRSCTAAFDTPVIHQYFHGEAGAHVDVQRSYQIVFRKPWITTCRDVVAAAVLIRMKRSCVCGCCVVLAFGSFGPETTYFNRW